MLMDWDYLVDKYHLSGSNGITGIVHCGAHKAEEADDYAQLGVPVWWIEANPRALPYLESYLSGFKNQQIIPACLSDTVGEPVTFNISGPDYEGSSSLLPWGTHRNFSPLHTIATVDLVTTTLNALTDRYGFAGVNMVVTDLQGMDPVVLSAAGRLLDQCRFVMSEVNSAQVYQGCVEIDAFDLLMGEHGFERVETLWVGDQQWGDAFFQRVE